MTITPSTSATAMGLSGMRAAQRQLDASAHNVANLQAPGFRREPAASEPDTGSSLGVHLAEDMVAQRRSVYTFAASLKTVQAQDAMLGALLDMKV